MSSPESIWGCSLQRSLVHPPPTNVAFMFLQFQFFVVFCVTQAIHLGVFKHFGLTPLVSQLVAGWVLSPHSFLKRNDAYDAVNDFIFPLSSNSIWRATSTLGYGLSLFIIAVKMDFANLLKAGRHAYIIGVLSFFIPYLVSYASLGFVTSGVEGLTKEDMNDFVVNVGTLHFSNFQVVVCLLDDLGILTSELGRLALSSSLIGTSLSVGFTMVQRFVLVEIHGKHDFVQIIGPVGLLLAGILILRPLMKWVIKQTPKDRPVKNTYVMIVYLVVQLGALATDYSKQFIVLGLFIMGTVVPNGPPLGSALVDKFDTLISGILQPFFITTCVMKGDMGSILRLEKAPIIHLQLAAISFASKITVCLIWGLSRKMVFQDALAFSLMLAAKGYVDIGSFTVFLASKMLTLKGFTVLSFWATIVAAVVPVMIRWLYDPLRKYASYQKRDIMHTREDAELRLLACIHRPDNIAAIMNLIDFYGPTEGSRIDIYALHLQKLVGQAHPVFISHDLQKKKAAKYSYSEEVVWAFDHLESNNKNVISTHVFTVVTPCKLMHDDVCTLALDKSTSLIILPFHCRWRIDGSTDSVDHDQRALNNNILERAPCSVAVLIDRRHSGHPTAKISKLSSISVAESDTFFQVAVIFIGGNDDQEALAFAKRMAKGKKIKVDVIRLSDTEGELDLDPIDLALLMELVNYKSIDDQFTYKEKQVEDGAELALWLKSVVGQYDMIIVGRRYKLECNQTAGLNQWNEEEEELGVIGDLLVSTDFHCTASILVVQHQRQHK
ncbi:hypothetical protein Ancab_011740 [Ancistrocladus abbreviatus]